MGHPTRNFKMAEKNNVYQVLLALLGPGEEHEPLHSTRKSDFCAVKPSCAPNDIALPSDHFQEGEVSSGAGMWSPRAWPCGNPMMF